MQHNYVPTVNSIHFHTLQKIECTHTEMQCKMQSFLSEFDLLQ